MKRLNHRFRKGLALLLTLTMAAGLVPAMSGGADTVQAAAASGTGNTPSVSAYATKEQMMDGTFAPDSNGNATTIGKLVFGKNSSGTAQEWYILGKDTGVSGDNTIIFAASPIATNQVFEDDSDNKYFEPSFGVYERNPSEVYPNHYGASDIRGALKGMASNTSYFTTAEQGLMNPTTVTTTDTYNPVTYTTKDTLYALQGDYSNDKYLWAGTGDSTVLAMNSYWSSGDRFWLRSPDVGMAYYALLAFPGTYVYGSSVDVEYAVRPASNLNLSSVLFASSAKAASSETVMADTITSGKAMTLRLDGSSENIGKAYFSNTTGIIRAEKTGGDNISLVVQGKGVIGGLESDWYYSKQITGTEIIDASDIKNTLNLTDDIDLSACKIWLEKTAANGMVYAVEAKDIRSIATNGHQLFVKTTSGYHITLEVEPTNTIQKLKAEIYDKKGISPETQRLLFKGKELKDEYCISDYCILKDDTLQLLIKSSVEPYIMNIGASHLQGNSGWEKTDGLKIRFGKYAGSVTEYRVLGDTPDTQSVTGETGILLNADKVIENSHMQFNNTGNYLQQFYNNGDVLSALEKAAIMETTLNARDEYTVNGNKFSDTESSDYIFLLSAFEAANLYLSDADRNNGAHCWLRSVDSINSSNAASYYGNGVIDTYECSNPYVRVTPAFNIKPSSILFTFHSNVDKSTANGITNKKYSDASYNNNTWKLTLYDSGKVIKVMDSKKVVRDSDNKISIPFDYMTDLSYEVNQVSVMITDKGYEDNSAKILYYGKLDTATENEYSSGSTKEVYGNGTFVLPEELKNRKLGEDYHLYMMAEHISENNTTDYSSAPKEITDVVTMLEQFKLNVDTPNAGSVLDTSVTCDTEGISINSVTWTDIDDISIVPTGEKAGYNKKYSISVNLSAVTGYKFTDTVTATISGNTASVTKNTDGTLTVTYNFPTTAKRVIESVTAPTAPTTFTTYYGYDGYDAGPIGISNSELGTQATVTFTDSVNPNTEAMDVTWEIENTDDAPYDKAPGATNTFRWTIPASEFSDYNVGSCTDYDSVSGTITGTVTIKNKAATPVTITGTDKGMAYTGAAIDVSKYFAIDTNAGAATYSLVTGADGGTGEGSLNGTTLTVTKTGTFKIKVSTAANGIYAAGEKNITLTIANGTIEYTATDYSGTYDGKAHTISVNVTNPSGTKVTFSTDGVTYGNDNPSFTEAGTYTVYYRIAKDNYDTINGSKTVTIVSKKDINAPYIKDDNGKEGWDVILGEVKKAQDKDKIIVDMNGSSVVPGNVLDEIKGKDITIVLDMGNGITWSINGQSITTDNVGDIDFAVKTGTKSIPVDIINNVTGERYNIQISLNHSGDFGFTAVLSVNVDKKNAGLYANLFYYNETAGKMDFICADKIAEDGIAELNFTHASDYAIVIDTEPMDGNAPDTGDNIPVVWLFIISIISGTGVILTTKKGRKNLKALENS